MRGLLKILVILVLLAKIETAVEFTNIVCTSLDKSFSDFEYCFLKSVNRTYKYLSIKVNIYKVPITHASITWTVLKKANGYKPFLYNITLDGCEFMKSRSKHPVMNYFYGFLEPFTNMNHTCPYEHDVMVEKLHVGSVGDRVTKILPVPIGEYSVYTKWYINGFPKAIAQLYMTIA